MLVAGAGLVWSNLGQAIDDGWLLETPMEVDNALCTRINRSGLSGEFVSDADLTAWSGPPAAFLRWYERLAYPWLFALVADARAVLRSHEFAPTRIELVSAPPGDPLPLLCRVLERQPGGLSELATVEQQAEAWFSHRRISALVRDSVSGLELLRFPPVIASYAAIGTRYWNIDHPKVIALADLIVDVSLYLDSSAQPLRHPWMRSRTQHVLKIHEAIRIRMNNFGGSPVELSIQIIEAARLAGSTRRAEPLGEDDVLPGTWHMTRNPLDYSIAKWRNSPTPVGVPLRDWKWAGG
jgi:hypothetical protein